MKKKLGIFASSFLLAVGSMFMIKAVQNTNILQTMFWEFVGPFMYLLYNHYFIEAKGLKQRIILTVVNGLGLALGAAAALILYNYYATK